jgi:uncharacterized protein (TIGR02596 family)
MKLSSSFHAKVVRAFRGVAAQQRPAFTLIEMLLVVAVIGILVGLATPTLFRTLQGNRLTTAGERLLNQIALVQQMAATLNRPMEIRFYQYEKESELVGGLQFHAYQVFELPNASTEIRAGSGGLPVTETPSSEVVDLGESIVIASSSRLTPFATGPLLDDGRKYVQDYTAKYFAVRFYPNGTTNLPKNISSSYLTLISDSDVEKDPPANFYTIQVDPYTGKARPYRP